MKGRHFGWLWQKLNGIAVLDSDVLAKVGEIVNQGLGLGRWREAARDLQKRKKILSEFYTKIHTPNRKPKKRKKTRYIPAVFEGGDCLVLHLPFGKFGAGLVLAANNTSKPVGTNLFAVLQFCGFEKPAIEVFELRKWLVLTHHAWKNQQDIVWYFSKSFKRHTHPIEKIGSIVIQSSDPKNCGSYTGHWNGLAESVELHFNWDAGKAPLKSRRIFPAAFVFQSEIVIPRSSISRRLARL